MRNKLNTLINAGSVRRFHTGPVIKDQDVAQHTFNVMVIIDIITNGQASPELMRATLYHDTPEVDTGDVPANVKRMINIKDTLEVLESRFYKEFNINTKLTKAEKGILKVADKLEFLHYLLRERILGNKNNKTVFERGREYFLTELDKLKISSVKSNATELYQYIIQEYNYYAS